MAPFKETESSHLCASEIPSCRPVRPLTSFEKAINMKNMLSVLVQLLPTSSSSVLENLSKCTISWDRTKMKGICRSEPFFPKWKQITHIDTRSLQVVRKHKGHRNWLSHALTKKEKVRKQPANLIFHNMPSQDSLQQVTLTEESNILTQPSDTFAKRTFQRTTNIPYALRSFPESLKPPIKIMIQFTRTRTCGKPSIPSLDYMTVDSTKKALEPKIIESRSQSSISSKRFKPLETSSSSESVSTSESCKSSISSLVMVTLPKALSETLKCASALSNSGKLSLEKFVSKSATSHFKISKEVIERHSSFRENSMQSSSSYDSLSTSGSSVSFRTSTEEGGGKESRTLNTTYLRKLPRCKKRLKVDMCSAKKYSCKKRCKMSWLKSGRLLRISREKFNKQKFTAQDVNSPQENEPKIVSRKRDNSVEITIAITSQKPAKLPHINRSVSVMVESDETDHEHTIEQDMSSPPDTEPLDLQKPLKTIESGRTMSSSERDTSPDTWSAGLTPVASRIISPACTTRSMSRTSKFPSVTRRKRKRRAEKVKEKKIRNSNFGPKTKRSRRRCHRSRGKKFFLPKELFLLPAKESLLHFVHSISPEMKSLSPIRSVCVTKKAAPQRNGLFPETASKGPISPRNRPHSAIANSSQQKLTSGRKRPRSGTPRALSAIRRPITPSKMYLPVSERPRLKIKRPRVRTTSATKLPQYLSDQSDTEVKALPATARFTSCSTSQPEAVGEIFPPGRVRPPLKYEQLDSKGWKHPFTTTKLLLTPLMSSPSCITTSPFFTIQTSSPASSFTPVKTAPETSAPPNVKSSSAHSTRGDLQTHTLTKKPSSQGTRSSSPATPIHRRRIRRSNRKSPTQRRVCSPTEITRKPTAELNHPFLYISNSKRDSKRKSQMSEKRNPKMKRKKSPKRNTFTPTKATRTSSKTTATTGGEKSSLPNHITRNSFHSVDPPVNIVRIPSRIVQRSRSFRKPTKILRASSPIASTPSSVGRSTSLTAPPPCPNGPPPSPVGRPSSPISRPVSPISRPVSPIPRTTSPIRRTASRTRQTASRTRRTASRTGRTASRTGRTASRIVRKASPIGLTFSGITRTPSRSTWTPTRSTRKSRRTSRVTSPPECTSNQLPSTPTRKRRAQSRRVQEPAKKIQSPQQSTRKQNMLPGLSCPGSFVTRSPPLSALASSVSSFPFQSSVSSSRCINTPLHSASSTSRSLNTTIRSMSNFSRSANKSSRIPCTPTDRVSSLNRTALTSRRTSCTPVNSTRSRSEIARSFSRNTRVTSSVTRTPTRIIRKLSRSNRKPKRISRKSTRTKIPSSIFFSPRIFFRSPSQSVRTQTRCTRSPSKTLRPPSRTRYSSSLRPNSPSQTSHSLTRSPSTPVACSTTMTQTAPTQTSSSPSNSTNSTPQAVVVCDRRPSSCPLESLQGRVTNKSRASPSWMRIGNTYLCITDQKDPSHRTTEIHKIRL